MSLWLQETIARHPNPTLPVWLQEAIAFTGFVVFFLSMLML